MYWCRRFEKYKKTLTLGLYALLYFVGLAILLFNIVGSQTISPLYSKLEQNKQTDVERFLKLIRYKEEFLELYRYYKNKYGPSLEKGVFSEEYKNKEYANTLKSLLYRSPSSRDLLYNLFLVERNSGERFFQKAQQIDPEIVKPAL